MKNMKHLPKIEINIKPYKQMRYATEGDYYFDGKTLKIDISKMDNPLVELMIIIHELWEWYRITEKGIKIEDIDKFDKECGLEDPGLSPLSPYHTEHLESVELEKLMCNLAKINYKDYYNSQHI